MYTEYLISGDTVSAISMFALAWFIVGIFVGQKLPSKQQRWRRGSSSRPRRPRTSSGVVELYVGNLSYDVSDKELGKIFQKYGKVVSARVIRNNFNGKSKGFGFVEIADRADAQAALKDMNAKELHGRKVVVNEARSKARD